MTTQYVLFSQAEFDIDMRGFWNDSQGWSLLEHADTYQAGILGSHVFVGQQYLTMAEAEAKKTSAVNGFAGNELEIAITLRGHVKSLMGFIEEDLKNNAPNWLPEEVREYSEAKKYLGLLDQAVQEAAEKAM